jgi:hypothetical protein
LLRHAHEELRQVIELADQQRREGDEGHDLADRHLAALDQHRAEREDGDHGDRSGGTGEDRQDAPPGQHRILRAQQPPHDVAHRPLLDGEPRVALHHGDIAEHVADPAVDVVVIALDRLLPARGAPRHHHVQGYEDDGQDAKDGGQPRIQRDRGRHQQHHADQRRHLLAQQRQPLPEHRVRAGQDRADDRARSALGVIADRQGDRAIEGARHHREPPAMDEAVGGHGHRDARQDPDHAQRGPGADQTRWRFAAGERVDDPSEQHRLGELHQRRDEIGADEAGHDPRLLPE